LLIKIFSEIKIGTTAHLSQFHSYWTHMRVCLEKTFLIIWCSSVYSNKFYVRFPDDRKVKICVVLMEGCTRNSATFLITTYKKHKVVFTHYLQACCSYPICTIATFTFVSITNLTWFIIKMFSMLSVS